MKEPDKPTKDDLRRLSSLCSSLPMDMTAITCGRILKWIEYADQYIGELEAECGLLQTRVDMATPEITLVGSDDGWDWIYVDGELKDSGSGLSMSHLLSAMGLEHTVAAVDEDWLESEGCQMPQSLDDAVLIDMERRCSNG